MFFFKQKTAYEMRISDWSSDVCSSDLKAAGVFSLTRTVSDCVGIQRVASGSNGTDDVGRAIDVDCFAQAADVNINGAQFNVGVLAPHAVQQPFAGEYPARMFQKVPQQTEFSGAQGHHAAIPEDLVPDCIHFRSTRLNSSHSCEA